MGSSTIYWAISSSRLVALQGLNWVILQALGPHLGMGMDQKVTY